MTRKEIKEYKSYLQDLISSLPKDERDVNKWCDLIELRCMTDIDKIIFREDFESEVKAANAGSINYDQLSDILKISQGDISAATIFDNEGEVEIGSDRSEFEDQLNQLTNIWFDHLKHRQVVFKKYYPFKIAKDGSTIKILSTLSLSQKLYLFFLLASNRTGFSRTIQKRFEFDFEPIAFEAFKSILPSSAEKHLMGKGRSNDNFFSQKKYSKFKQLADILQTSIKQSEHYFKPKDTGENGIDFIGWKKFEDGLPNNIVYAGQATCMDDWSKKEYESSKDAALSGILDTSKIGGYINALFIPYHFKHGNNWVYSDRIEGRNFLLFDRYRIIYSIIPNQINKRLIPQQIIDDLI